MKQMIAWGKKHPFFAGFLLFFLLSCLFLGIFRLSPSFSYSYSIGVGAAVRTVLGAVSSLFPFSLFEVLILGGVGYLLFLLIYGIRCLVRYRREGRLGRYTKRLFLAVPLVLAVVFELFVWSFAASYFRPPLQDYYLPEEKNVGEEEIFYALTCLRDVIAENAPLLETNERGESVPPSWDEVRLSVHEAVVAFGEREDFFPATGFPVKTLLSSPWLTYTHISGIWGFFTGEGNVNTNYPHFIVTHAAAHESCHARGIGAENECNLLAAILLMESGDPYLAYCGAASLLDDLLRDASRLNKERTAEIKKSVSDVYWADMAYYSRFFEPYRDSAAATVANRVNDGYLKANGQAAGIRSYSDVSRLTAAYFQKIHS